MHSQLELLLEIQDLQAQRRALALEPNRDIEADVFALSPDEAVRRLDERIEEVADRLETAVGARWRELTGSVDRAVAPVIDGICYGCFVAVPTSWSAEAQRNDRLDVCETCGRFLYYLD
ncbi:MAG: C4-type zinc ribbon domain-containing protein [Gemmatimonadota bacterium]|nr:C4-type zinc ribbon domain-containing protein [Gemmatimonadota bacterium]